jgi:hypothetical protein
VALIVRPDVPPPVVVFRSIFRERLVYAVPGWLLEETPTHVVTATVPGAQTLQPSGPRTDQLGDIAAGREHLELMPWHTNRVVWLTPFVAAHAIGHFWDDASGRFLGYYVNLQEPLQRSPYGFDSCDHVLDIVIDPDGAWHWKDEDELDEAVELGLFTAQDVVDMRAEGERVIASLPSLLPTGWENWLPDPTWSPQTLILPPELRDGLANAELS